MPEGYPPSVFVSSTCYDLNQIRADLRRFLTDMGLDPILSETPNFPVSPQTGAVANCLRAVKERADIFVLIIGGRYGSQNQEGKSITNLEYLEAKAKGLPIYVFVSKRVLNVLPIWKKNPAGNYEDVADTPKLFEFVESLRTSQDHWIFEFDEVLHITNTLRSQLPQLFMEGLILRETLKNLKLPGSLANLSAKPLKILMERSTAWEYLLFSSVLADEIACDQELKWDLKYGLKIKTVQTLDDLFSVNRWLHQKFAQATGFMHSFEQILNSAMQEALGKPGEPGNPEHIVYVARRLGKIRRAFLEWTIDFNCTEVLPECERLLFLISSYLKDAIEQIENFPSRIDAEISKALDAKKRGEAYVADVYVVLRGSPHQTEIEAEFRRLSRLI